MEKNLVTMENAVKKSIEGNGVFSPTGLTGGDAVKIKKYRENGKTLSGDWMMFGVQSAFGVNEVNCSDGGYLCNSNSRREWNDSRSTI